jgi:hypothetical protein
LVNPTQAVKQLSNLLTARVDIVFPFCLSLNNAIL